MKITLHFDDDSELLDGTQSPNPVRSYAVSDEVLDEFLANLRTQGKLDDIKVKYEDSPRSQLLLLLMVSHLETGGKTEDSFKAAEQRLDAAIAKAEAQVSV